MVIFRGNCRQKKSGARSPVSHRREHTSTRTYRHFSSLPRPRNCAHKTPPRSTCCRRRAATAVACRPGETASFEATRVPFDPHRDDDGATPPPTSLAASSEPRICTTIGRACSGRVMPTPKRELQMPTICTKRSSRSSCSRLLPRLCRSSEVRRPRHRHRPHRGCGPRTAPRGMARKRNERAGQWRGRCAHEECSAASGLP
jgi:hypothetical protein